MRVLLSVPILTCEKKINLIILEYNKVRSYGVLSSMVNGFFLLSEVNGWNKGWL